MRKTIFKGAVAALLAVAVAGCGKSPESIVNDAYKSASEKKYENIAAYVLPDSLEQFNENELKNFAELMSTGFWQNDYSSFTVDSVVTNPEETEAAFVVRTNFNNGLSFTETGLLRKTEKGTWRLMVDREASDTVDVFSVSDQSKMTPELMRNLHYATVMTLAGRGLPQYQVMAAKILQAGILTSRDDERAFDLLKSAADKNYIPAYKLLGDVYDKGGKNITKDEEKAFEWYLKAADAGDVTAYEKVGTAYYKGQGAIKDYDKAKEWYEKGVSAEDPACMRGLAWMYLPDTKGFENNFEKAFKLLSNGYETAVKTKNNDEIRSNANTIGYCYYNGYGVPKDMNKAMEWFSISAEAGNKTAMDNLGVIYYYGNNGVTKDYNKAYYWCTKAAKAGVLRGEYLVGECYEYGRGVDMNKSKAKEIYGRLWRENSYQDAGRGMSRLYNY